MSTLTILNRNGNPLSKKLYTYDEKTQYVSTLKTSLVIQYAGSSCTIKTRHDCTIMTRHDCTIETGDYCTIETGSNCTIKTGSSCTIKTGANCTIETGFCCTIMTGSDCVVVRRDIFEIIQPECGTTIKLNMYGIPGFIILHKERKMKVQKDDGSWCELTISEETWNQIMKSKK